MATKEGYSFPIAAEKLLTDMSEMTRNLNEMADRWWEPNDLVMLRAFLERAGELAYQARRKLDRIHEKVEEV